MALLAAPSAEARTVGDVGLVGDVAVEIRRTTDGIPHIRASGWRELGAGVGYAQAQDALCTLAESFVTFEGRRSWYFGPDQRPVVGAVTGRTKNLDSDVFFRAFANDAMVQRYSASQPTELNALIEGFAAGYNRFLQDARRHPERYAHRPCLQQEWVREIQPPDIYRRMYAAQIMAGYGQFITEIANAAPAKAGAVDSPAQQELRMRLANNLGADASLGSNMIAWGSRATGGDGAVLFGNPHWGWGGPDRFYQMHLTIPGSLNVAGVSFLGIPLVMIGFNENVAWSHTVSRARRFGLFELSLDPADPRRYVVDGVSESMQARQVSVEVRDADGRPASMVRTLYSTRFGPIVDLGSRHASLGWGDRQAVAIRDVNAENPRSYRNFLAWGQAGSLDDFIAIQLREAAMPWVNTVAIGKGDDRVWYADVGAVPNVPDELRTACATPSSEAFARFDARVPFLDGSRSSCNWLTEDGAVQAGAMPARKQPRLLREDYVANMNDSHWLSNVNAPLEGFAALFGEERQALHLRGRLGHQIAIALLQQGAASSEELSRMAMREVLTTRSYSAEQFKPVLLDQACSHIDAEPPDEAENLGRACDILRRWPNTAEPGDRGTLLWEAFWTELSRRPIHASYQVGFSPDAPLTTPAVPLLERGAAAKALAQAAATLLEKGLALDMPLGTVRFVRSGGRPWPIYGGCNGVGYFTIACPTGGRQTLGPEAVGNSYLQVVRFGEEGVEAHTLLPHGQDETAVSNGLGAEPVARYARKEWLLFPFRESDIEADPELTRTVLHP